MSNENKYWLVKNIDYEKTVILSNSELIKNFDRDHRRNESRFWPGSVGVLNYLMQNVPGGAVIADDRGKGFFPANG